MEVHILYAPGSRVPPPRFQLLNQVIALGAKKTARCFCFVLLNFFQTEKLKTMHLFSIQKPTL